VEALTLDRLRDLPLRLPERDANPPLVDLVTAACRAAGFEPRLAPAMNDQDMLAAIAAGPPTWTVYYAAQAEALATTSGVVFRAPAGPPLRMPTVLADPVGRLAPSATALLAACRAVA
jgi:LysR substrate binding domain-containing protein